MSLPPPQRIAKVTYAAPAVATKTTLHDPVFIYLALIGTYVALQFLTILTSSGLLKALSYATAFSIFLAMAVISGYLPKERDKSLGFGLALGLYYYGFFGSAFANLSVLDYGTAIKMMMGPMFLLFGVAFESRNQFRSWSQSSTRWIFGLLVVLPFALWIVQLASKQIEFGGTGVISIFANRNNAGLYAVTLIALFNVLREQPLRNMLIYCLAGASFGTLGVMVAVMIALAVSVGGRRSILFICISALLVSAILYFVPLEIGIFSRVKPVVDSVKLIVDGRVDIATVSYGDLVRLLQTTDLSFLFRLKHWLNLFSIFAAGPLEHWFFGFGIGSSMLLSNIGLVPHNDYIRVFFECGPVTFAGFVATIVLILYRCGRRWESVPLITVAIYFFSENLIDNFVAMSIFFFCGGAMAYRFSINKETT